MHSYLQIAILELDAVEGIVDVLAARRIDAHHVDSSQIQPVGEFLGRNGELLARGREAVVGSLTELADLHVVLKQNCVSLSLIIAYFADDFHEVAERVLGMGRPSV